MKKNLSFYCTNCGSEYTGWSGRCASCGEWNTIVEKEISQMEKGLRKLSTAKIENLADVKMDRKIRVSSGFVELDRVLGADSKSGGFLPGQVCLISGDPGVGKSTLLLQVVGGLVRNGRSCVYVSAEESSAQIAIRAKRVIGRDIDKIKVISSYNLEGILEALEKEKPDFVVVDSIQTISSSLARGTSGGLAQVKTCAIELVNYAKSNDVTLVIVGHITKEGNIAGPKVLEHLVDTVLQMEGDEKSGFRLVRSLKNRFGGVNEVGIFAMEEEGMVDIKNAADYFVSGEMAEGVCRSAILEGTRVLVVEVQALTSRTVFSQPKRVAEGITSSRLQVICAILLKHAGLKLYDYDVYVNIAGGLRVKDPSIDFATALAIASSLKGKKLPPKSVALGELSLTGGVMHALRSEIRKKELDRVGYKRVLDASKFSNVSAAVREIFS